MTTFIFLQLILNIFIFLKISKISKFINIFDRPDGDLKKHRFNTPLLGGVIILLNLSLILLCDFFFDYDLLNYKFSFKEKISGTLLLFLFFFLGLFDDKYSIKPEKKITLSILFSVLILILNNNLLISEIKLSFIDNQLYLHDFSYLFTIFCIVILINAINFYDGINGQSSIFFIICFTYLGYKSPIFSFYILIIIALVFILSLNLHNKIFMGDNGIYLVTSILIMALIYEYNKFSTIEFADEIFFLLIIPGYDLLRLTLVRIYNGKNAFYGDRNHLHHMIMKKYSLLKTNLILVFLNLIPIILYSMFKIGFFKVLLTITTIYFILILKLKGLNKKK
jgi:UDP-GlcNAc:undecaprenyl-phosphate GlcNAc-1-phosphate transferase